MELKTTFALSHPPTHIWMFGLGKMGKIGAISDENLHIFAYFVRVNAINKVYNASPSSQVSFSRFFFFLMPLPYTNSTGFTVRRELDGKRSRFSVDSGKPSEESSYDFS